MTSLILGNTVQLASWEMKKRMPVTLLAEEYK
jgi:hypothetical protein